MHKICGRDGKYDENHISVFSFKYRVYETSRQRQVVCITLTKKAESRTLVYNKGNICSRGTMGNNRRKGDLIENCDDWAEADSIQSRRN